MILNMPQGPLGVGNRISGCTVLPPAFGAKTPQPEGKGAPGKKQIGVPVLAEFVPTEKARLEERVRVLEKALAPHRPTWLGNLGRRLFFWGLLAFGGNTLWTHYQDILNNPPAQGFVRDSMSPDKLKLRESITQDLQDSVGLNLVQGISSHLAKLADYAKPAVVYISDVDRRSPYHGAGSGFIVAQDGYIVTNAHVVDGLKEVMINFYDGSQMKGDVLGVNTTADLAVVKVNRVNLPTLKLAPTGSPKEGEMVMVMGHPQRFGWSASIGILSGTGRHMSPDPLSTPWTQTDAAINPGNSGGPLLNMKGEVIGLNSRKIGGANNDNLGFSVPLEDLQSLIPVLSKPAPVPTPGS